MRRRRRRHRAAELTPLIDVLFILLFASLLQARTAVEHDEAEKISKLPDAGVDDASVDAGMDGGMDASMDASVDASMDASVDAGPSEHLVQSRQIAARLAGAVENRDVFVVEVEADGHVTSMARWRGGQEVRRDRMRYRLVRPVLPGESDREFVYLSGSDPAMRLCSLAREHFERAADDDEPFMVLVVLDAPLSTLPLDLYLGLNADLKSCFADAAGVGILLQPGDDEHGIP